MSLALDPEQIYAIAEGRHYELFSVLGQHISATSKQMRPAHGRLLMPMPWEA